MLSEPIQMLWMSETMRVLAEEDQASDRTGRNTRQISERPLHEYRQPPAVQEASGKPAMDPAQQELSRLVAERADLAECSVGEQARFLALHKGDPGRALAGLEQYYVWLNSPHYGVERVRDIGLDNVALQAQLATRKCYLVRRKDREDRPVVVVHVDRHTPAASPLDDTTVLVVHTLFAAQAALSDKATGTFSIVFDLSKARYANIDLPLIQRFVAILTDFYPERLGVMLLLDAPSFFPALCWPLIRPWLNPVTRSKVHFASSDADPSTTHALSF